MLAMACCTSPSSTISMAEPLTAGSCASSSSTSKGTSFGKSSAAAASSTRLSHTSTFYLHLYYIPFMSILPLNVHIGYSYLSIYMNYTSKSQVTGFTSTFGGTSTGCGLAKITFHRPSGPGYGSSRISKGPSPLLNATRYFLQPYDPPKTCHNAPESWIRDLHEPDFTCENSENSIKQIPGAVAHSWSSAHSPSPLNRNGSS